MQIHHKIYLKIVPNRETYTSMYLLEIQYCRKVFDFVDRAVCNNFVRLYEGQFGTIDFDVLGDDIHPTESTE